MPGKFCTSGDETNWYVTDLRIPGIPDRVFKEEPGLLQVTTGDGGTDAQVGLRGSDERPEGTGCV